MVDKKFPYKEVAKLDSDERKGVQPVEPVVSIIAEGASATILDVGVGTGYFALSVARALPKTRVVGLDIEPRMIEIFEERIGAQNLVGRVQSLLGSVDRAGGIPLEDDGVDIALMINIYHELDSRLTALAEVRRVLKPGGRLLICDWDPRGSADAGPPLEHRVDPDTVEQELAERGFHQCERRDLYEHFWVIISS